LNPQRGCLLLGRCSTGQQELKSRTKNDADKPNHRKRSGVHRFVFIIPAALFMMIWFQQSQRFSTVGKNQTYRSVKPFITVKWVA
jgi:hypothetical protein